MTAMMKRGKLFMLAVQREGTNRNDCRRKFRYNLFIKEELFCMVF